MCETKFCDFSVLLMCGRGCLLILRPDCLCFYLATVQKDSKFAKMLLDNTSRGQRDSKFNWLGGCYLHCGPHLSMIFGNQGQLGRRTMQESCISGLYVLYSFCIFNVFGFLSLYLEGDSTILQKTLNKHS